MKNYYQILELTQTASPGEIKAAYRRLSFRYHPDLNNDINSEDNFKKVNEAHQILSDPVLRQLFDKELSRRNISYTHTRSDYISTELKKSKRTSNNIIYIFLFFITGFLVTAVSPSFNSVNAINEYKANLTKKSNDYFLTSQERDRQIDILVRRTNSLVDMFRSIPKK